MSEQSCTCFQGHAPCSYCEQTSVCDGCGVLFYDHDRDTNESEVCVCPKCEVKYRHILEGHELDCTCRACLAFVNEDDAEAGFKVAIPILIADGKA